MPPFFQGLGLLVLGSVIPKPLFQFEGFHSFSETALPPSEAKNLGYKDDLEQKGLSKFGAKTPQIAMHAMISTPGVDEFIERGSYPPPPKKTTTWKLDVRTSTLEISPYSKWWLGKGNFFSIKWINLPPKQLQLNNLSKFSSKNYSNTTNKKWSLNIIHSRAAWRSLEKHPFPLLWA